MERIASFQVDHNKLEPGLYLSRRDGEATTVDLRFKKPNTGDLLSNAEMHSVERAGGGAGKGDLCRRRGLRRPHAREERRRVRELYQPGY